VTFSSSFETLEVADRVICNYPEESKKGIVFCKDPAWKEVYFQKRRLYHGTTDSSKGKFSSCPVSVPVVYYKCWRCVSRLLYYDKPSLVAPKCYRSLTFEDSRWMEINMSGLIYPRHSINHMVIAAAMGKFEYSTHAAK